VLLIARVRQKHRFIPLLSTTHGSWLRVIRAYKVVKETPMVDSTRRPAFATSGVLTCLPIQLLHAAISPLEIGLVTNGTGLFRGSEVQYGVFEHH
jgi:hypothetical protein